MSKIDDFDWSEPPAVTRGRGAMKFADEAQALRNNPGHWMRVDKARTGANRPTIFRDKSEFEVANRVVDGGFDLYARYIGA